MTLLAYFVVAAVPLGLLALVSWWVASGVNDQYRTDPLKWWHPGAGILLIVGLVVGLYAGLAGIFAALTWAARTLGWIA